MENSTHRTDHGIMCDVLSIILQQVRALFKVQDGLRSEKPGRNLGPVVVGGSLVLFPLGEDVYASESGEVLAFQASGRTGIHVAPLCLQIQEDCIDRADIMGDFVCFLRSNLRQFVLKPEC